MSRRKLYIGAKFVEDGIKYSDGSLLPATTVVTLHCPSDRKYYRGTATSNSTGLTATFSADVTAVMQPGVYDLELYKDSTMDEVIWVEHEYCDAVRASVTTGETDSTPSESESESGSESEGAQVPINTPTEPI